MTIYGTALLAACLLVGLLAGRCLGALCGLQADLGGVGLAMLLLVLASAALRRWGLLAPPTEAGVQYWGQLYVPIIVAMTASQNVLGALSGGALALAAGLGTVAVSMLLVRILVRALPEHAQP